MKHKGYTAAFASGERFKKKKIEEIPGPGTYRNPKTIVNDLMKKPGGKKGAFGSEEIWFPVHSIQELDAPGPGEYNPLESMK